MDASEQAIIDEVIADLTTELTETDDNFDATILTSKVTQAYREVKGVRNYPSSYTTAMVVADIEKFYPNIRNIALYDYNQVGGEFQKSHNENSINITWQDRDSLFAGIIPLSRTQ